MDNPEVSDLVCNFIFRTAEHYRDNSSVIILDAVSYTHLDVYKRQDKFSRRLI